MDGSQEVPGEFVVTSRDTPEILEPAETTLDHIAPFIGALAEAWRVTLLDLFGMTGFAPRLTISARKPSPSLLVASTHYRQPSRLELALARVSLKSAASALAIEYASCDSSQLNLAWR